MIGETAAAQRGSGTDLTKHHPRSPWETLGGVYTLPRAIEKMRGFVAGTVGPYYSHTGLSRPVFEFFGTDASTFEEIVRTHGTDEGVLAALMAIRSPSAEDIAAVNLRLSWSPDCNPKGLAFIENYMSEHGLGHRSDLVTYFDLMEVDEGRDVPVGGRARLSADGTVRQPAPPPVA